MKAFIARNLFDGTGFHVHRAILVENGVVQAVTATDVLPECERIEIGMLAPGFVDVQVNGGGGVMFNDAPDVATLRLIAGAHARLGTTAILPTLISSDAATRSHALNAVREAIAACVPGIAGLHLEGPFLAPSRRGIHPARAITALSDNDITELNAGFPAPMLITLAPETVPIAAIRALCAAGRIVFAGHSEANFAEANAGFDAGISGTTHLYNAMSQLTGRAPGLVGATLLRGHAGIIVDLLHVDAASIRIAHQIMGAERLFLVSDAMATTGSNTTSFAIDGNTITLHHGKLCDAHGTLAGAHLCMAEAVRNAVHHIGITPADALRMATHTPAEAMGLSRHGRIAPDCRADFVELGDDLAVLRVWQNGEVIT
jgi:N-acetylglucosamine-6-phosphate deacetylase